MPLLLVPLLVLGVMLLWALLLPLSMLQRYRHGKARRRAQAQAVRVNAWLLLGSVPLFLLGAWLGGYWVAGAPAHAAAGLGAGMIVGLIGIRLTRFERTPQGLYFTSPAWLVALLTALVVARLVIGFWQLLQRWHLAGPLPTLAGEHASVFAVAGLLLGYYLGYAWALKRRLG